MLVFLCLIEYVYHSLFATPTLRHPLLHLALSAFTFFAPTIIRPCSSVNTPYTPVRN